MTTSHTDDPWACADHDPTDDHPITSEVGSPALHAPPQTTYGQAPTALYAVYTDPVIATAELGADVELDGPWALGLWNEDGDGLVLEGSRGQLLTYLLAATAAVRASGDPVADLDQALRRHQHLCTDRATALEHNRFEDAAQLDDEEIDILREIAELAQLVTDEP
jgi:hypothetical protein